MPNCQTTLHNDGGSKVRNLCSYVRCNKWTGYSSSLHIEPKLVRAHLNQTACCWMFLIDSLVEEGHGTDMVGGENKSGQTGDAPAWSGRCCVIDARLFNGGLAPSKLLLHSSHSIRATRWTRLGSLPPHMRGIFQKILHGILIDKGIKTRRLWDFNTTTTTPRDTISAHPLKSLRPRQHACYPYAILRTTQCFRAWRRR